MLTVKKNNSFCFSGNLSVEILGKRDSLYSQRRNISTCESNTLLAVNIFG